MICHRSFSSSYPNGGGCLKQECVLWDAINKQCSDLTKNLTIEAIYKMLDIIADRLKGKM